MKLPLAPVDAMMDHFKHGIKLDQNYYLNYLNIGHTFRLKRKDYM